jgi:hypothetical protein
MLAEIGLRLRGGGPADGTEGRPGRVGIARDVYVAETTERAREPREAWVRSMTLLKERVLRRGTL